MLQSEKNNATLSILGKLRNQGMPKASMMPAPFEEDEALAGEQDVEDSGDGEETLNDMSVEPASPEKKKSLMMRPKKFQSFPQMFFLNK